MKIVICGNYGVSNIGDEAILKGLRFLLAMIQPNAEIGVMGKGRHFPFGIRSFLKSLFQWNRWAVSIKLVKSADIFILGGGGLFSDEEGLATPFWALHALAASYVFKKPLFILGVSVGPMSWISRYLSKKAFLRSELITVRDISSRDILKKWELNSITVPDFAALVPWDKKPVDTNRGKYVVMSVRPYKNSDDDLYTKLAQLCDCIIGKYALSIRLLPFQDGGENDLSVLNKILVQCENKNNIKIEPYYSEIRDVLGIISGAEFVIGMRLHAGIFSLIAGTPFIPLSYMDKVSSFWSQFEGIKTIKMKDSSPDALMAAFNENYQKKRKQREYLVKIKADFEKYLEIQRNLIEAALRKIN